MCADESDSVVVPAALTFQQRLSMKQKSASGVGGSLRKVLNHMRHCFRPGLFLL